MIHKHRAQLAEKNHRAKNKQEASLSEPFVRLMNASENSITSTVQYFGE